MDLNLHQIGHFQFENLIQNRIPFLFLHFGQDLKEVFQPHHLLLAQTTPIFVKDKLRPSKTLEKIFRRNHFENQSLENLVIDLEKRGYSKDHAVVVLCEKGEASEALVKALLQRGFQNCFYVLGGFEQLKQDAKMNA